MITPQADLYTDKLRALVRAGTAGLPLADVGAGTGVHMDLTGIANLSGGRVVATAKARAQLQQMEWSECA